jgi:neopullulanase
MEINTPEWVKNAVFYQIFPDRFARSPRTPHPPGLVFKPWGADPTEQGYQGGDLYGIAERLDYLQALGITALYLNPIFSSASNHRYHAFDYLQIDPLLGGNAALRDLLDQAHARGIRVVLDGVFNHASRGFWPFHHILENGSNSPYIDWFFIYGWPLNPYPKDGKTPLNYAAWANLAGLPKINTKNPGARAYLMEVARYWIEFGCDGWRLDVPNEIDDDAFWQEFRQAVKAANPEAYIVGEIWGDGRRWLQGDQFDAIMNYVFMGQTLYFFGGKSLRTNYIRDNFTWHETSAQEFAYSIERLLESYAWPINLAQLNLIDSHDTARALWIMKNDQRALRQCVLYQMTMPGAPCIYYGDEIGLSAGDDPRCRGAFPWQQPETWDQDLLSFYKQAIALRHKHPVLRTGGYRTIYAEDKVYAFLRYLDDGQQALVIFNAGKHKEKAILTLQQPGETHWKTIWPTGEEHTFYGKDGLLTVTLPARSELVLLRS